MIYSFFLRTTGTLSFFFSLSLFLSLASTASLALFPVFAGTNAAHAGQVCSFLKSKNLDSSLSFENSNHFDSLDEKVCTEILSYLLPEDLPSAALTTKILREAAIDPWTRNCIQENWIKTVIGKLIPIPATDCSMVRRDRQGRVNKHPVHLSPFEISESAITQEAYARIMGSNPSYFKDPQYCPLSFKKLQLGKKVIPVCADFPVEQVSWEQAQSFIGKVQTFLQREDIVLRLPTEAELSFVLEGILPPPRTPARPGARPRSHTYPPNVFSTDHFWFDSNSNRQTQPVKSRLPSFKGIYHSSVLEWTQDWILPSRPNPEAGPAHGSHSGQNELRVIRGCGWDTSKERCSFAYFEGGKPSASKNNLGFRLVRVRRERPT